MKLHTIILTVFAAAVFSACSTTEQPANQNANTVNAANTAVVANAASPADQTAVDTKPANPSLSPIETLKALSEASSKKEPAAIKSYLSRGTLDLLNQSAAKMNKPVDELLKQDGAPPFEDLPEILGENIEGETAVVEIENTVTKQNEKIPFVKENGAWKVALDVYLKNLENEFNQSAN